MSWNYFFKVVLWNDCAGEYGAEVIEYRAIQAKSFSEAVGVLEDFYGEDLISFEASCAEYKPILLTEENFKELWRGHISTRFWKE